MGQKEVDGLGKVFLIASGKGGVGKTTVSANMSAALSEKHRVLVIDADLDLSNLDLAFGLRNRHVYDLQDLYYRNCSFDDAVLSVPGHPNLFALFAPLRREVSTVTLLKFLRQLVEEKRRYFDYIFIDCPAGIGPTLEILADPRYETLIVTTPDRTAISDGERTADYLFRSGAGRVRLIVNRVRPSLIKKNYAPDIDDIIDSTSLQLIGLIPEDIGVICAGNGDTLAYNLPKSRSKKAFRNIALRVTGQSVDLDKFS